jgi:hypothetical protein
MELKVRIRTLRRLTPPTPTPHPPRHSRLARRVWYFLRHMRARHSRRKAAESSAAQQPRASSRRRLKRHWPSTSRRSVRARGSAHWLLSRASCVRAAGPARCQRPSPSQRRASRPRAPPRARRSRDSRVLSLNSARSVMDRRRVICAGRHGPRADSGRASLSEVVACLGCVACASAVGAAEPNVFYFFSLL